MKYKVGDRVRIQSLDWYNENKDEDGNIELSTHIFISEMSQFCGKVVTIKNVFKDDCENVDYNIYYMEEIDYDWTDEMIECKVGEEVGLVDVFSSRWVNEFDLPEGYIFKDENGNVINATKIVLEKKKKEYPTTIEECCEILGLEFNPFYTGVKRQVNYKDGLLYNLKCLLIYRDAYWKLYGEEMGLGKPWEPDWHDSEKKYTIECYDGEIIRDFSLHKIRTFSFPTEEMRDAFKENFDTDIEICKELL